MLVKQLLLLGHDQVWSHSVGILEGMWVWLLTFALFNLLGLLLLLGFLNGHLSLFGSILFGLDYAFPLRSLFQVLLFLGILLLLLQSFLSNGGSFSTEIFEFALLLSQLVLSLLLFNECIHLSILHRSLVRDERHIRTVVGHIHVVAHRGSCNLAIVPSVKTRHISHIHE